MSGLLALFDDVAAIAKLAASQLDDVAAQASKAGTKAAGVIIDDAAVTPKYATGLPAARELPIVWKIARASFFNKLVILLPAALLLNAFLPCILTACERGNQDRFHIVRRDHDNRLVTNRHWHLLDSGRGLGLGGHRHYHIGLWCRGTLG